MKLLIKEWKLCMHPFCFIAPALSVLLLVPGYPYGVCCFYVGLAVFFVCLTARENHDAAYTLTLPVSRRDAVMARILLCLLLEIAQLIVMGAMIPLRNAIGNQPNPAGLDAGLALIGEGMLIYAIFNMVFFPVYYRDINKPGKAFVFAGSAVFAWIILEVVATYAVPFVKNVLDRPDPNYMNEKGLFTFGALALLLAGTAWSWQFSTKKFEAVDLSL